MAAGRTDGCDDLPGGVIPAQASMKLLLKKQKASMKLSPPHWSPTLPPRGC